MGTKCISDLQCFPKFCNSSLFCTFWLYRNFYSGDAHHAKYDKHSLNNLFQHWAQSVYQIYSVFQNFAIAVCFAHFGFLEIWIPVIRTMLTMMNIVEMIVSDCCTLRISDLQCFPTFWNCIFFGKFWLIRNFSSGAVHHGNSGKHSTQCI